MQLYWKVKIGITHNSISIRTSSICEKTRVDTNYGEIIVKETRSAIRGVVTLLSEKELEVVELSKDSCHTR